MALQTRAVRGRIDRLIEFYISEDRDIALEKLIQTLRAAALKLDQAGPIPNVRTFPSVYRHLSLYGFRWFKLHAYWIGYADHDGRRVLVNFFYETDDMPSQLLLETDDVIEM